MIEDKMILTEEEKKLEEQLAKLPRKKWQIWRLIAVGILMPIIGPYIPMRRGTLEERMGYSESAWMFGLILIVAVPIGCYMHFQKVDEEIIDVKKKLYRLRLKQKESEDIDN